MKHPPLPLDRIAANLEFEMIGHKHPKLADNHVLMTGFDYSNLGPELVRQGGLVTQDPYPD